jgi:predicted nucleic acid-binding protein
MTKAQMCYAVREEKRVVLFTFRIRIFLTFHLAFHLFFFSVFFSSLLFIFTFSRSGCLVLLSEDALKRKGKTKTEDQKTEEEK